MNKSLVQLSCLPRLAIKGHNLATLSARVPFVGLIDSGRLQSGTVQSILQLDIIQLMAWMHLYSRRLFLRNRLGADDCLRLRTNLFGEAS